MSTDRSTTCELPAPPRTPPVTPARLPVAALLALAATAALILVTELLPVGLLAPMGVALHQSEGRTGFLASAYAAAATVGAIPLTALTRSLPRRPLLIALLGGFAVVNAVTALSSSYPLTIGVRLVGGLLGGVVWSMLASYAARIVRDDQRGRAIAIALSGITVALALGVPAGTQLARWIGWRPTFAVLAAVAAVLAGWIRWAVPAVRSGVSAGRTSLAGLVRMPGPRAVLAVTGLLLLGHQMLYTFLAPVAARSGLGDPGLVLLVFGLSAGLGIWAAGVLVDGHLRPAALASVGIVAAAVLGLGLAAGHAPALVIAVAVWGAAFGAAPTVLLTALISTAGPANADAATALQTTVYNIGVAGGSFAGGLVLDHAGAGALPWVALPLITAAGLVVAAATGTFRSCATPTAVPPAMPR
jgi:predicted MFS family arabinose efflux permease